MKKILVAIILVVVFGGGGLGLLYWKSIQGVSAASLEVEYMTSADRFVDIAGARVRIREQGRAEAPPILLVHGFSYSLETWDAWAEVLKEDYRVIRYDLLGHGLTGPDPLERYAPKERAAFIGDVLDALDVDRLTIVGNSLGGLATWLFASDNPARIEALVLISPGAFPHNGVTDEPAEVPAAMKAYLLAAPEAGVRASAEFIIADDTKITDKRLKTLRDMMRREGNGPAMIKSIEEFTLPDPLEALSRITAPTLILWGEQDVIIPAADGARLQQAIEGAELITYPGVGHTTHEEIPRQSVLDVLAFMERIETNRIVETE